MSVVLYLILDPSFTVVLFIRIRMRMIIEIFLTILSHIGIKFYWEFSGKLPHSRDILLLIYIQSFVYIYTYVAQALLLTRSLVTFHK